MKITDRRDRVWKDRCQHEVNHRTGKECGKLTNEDTGECPLGHGRSLHACHTQCCAVFLSGNHKYCEGHRLKQVKTICSTQKKISAEYSRRMGWTGNYKGINIETFEGRKDFNEWSQKQLDKTYTFPIQKEIDVTIP